MSALAVFCIGLGILSHIASNWQEIPDSPEAERGHFITGVDSSRGLSFLQQR
ncbi:MAG: hypothetical protein ACLU99_06490 [Alphaproteobacteria bacterium]